MSLSVNRDAFITCAVTGSADTADRSALVPVSPADIAQSAIEAARAGAAIVHIHVRDPDTGQPSRDPSLFRAVVDLIRAADIDVVLNLTAGMGGDLTLGSPEAPLPPDPDRTDMAGASERLAHISELLPEICTLDCGTMNFGQGDYVMTNTPAMLRAMASQMKALGVKPEIEVFDTGHLAFAKALVAEGLIGDPVLLQLCMGIPWGAPNDLTTFQAMVNAIPSDWIFSAFSIGRDALPYVAASVLAGGNVRIGLEDNLFVSKGVLATNADLVGRAVAILEAMNIKVLGPDEVRSRLKLKRRT